MRPLFLLSVFLGIFAVLAANAGSPEQTLGEIGESAAATTAPANAGVPEPWPHTVRVTAKKAFAPRSNAGSCATKNFQEKLGAVRNQDGLGWCAGMVAADLLSFELGYRVSDFDLSLQTHARFGKKLGLHESIAGTIPNRIARVVDTAIHEGVCEESGMPSNDRMLAELAAAKEKEGNKLTDADLSEGAAGTIKLAIQVLEKVRGLSAVQLTSGSDLGCDAIGFAASMFPRLSELQVLSGISNSVSNESLFLNFVSQSCQRKKVSLAPTSRFKRVLPGAAGPEKTRAYHLLKVLDQRIDAERPVAIVYRPNKFIADETDQLHTSIVVGREFRDGECKYLIRNSYGPSCGYYNLPYGEPKNCARGHFWISERDFAENVKMLEFLE